MNNRLTGWKRDGSPNPNDLFWANRGKKSLDSQQQAQQQFWPKPHSFMGPIFKAQGQRRAAAAATPFNNLRPNSFMNMYQNQQPKRSQLEQQMMALKNLRPNSFLFPSLSGQQQVQCTR